MQYTVRRIKKEDVKFLKKLWNEHYEKKIVNHRNKVFKTLLNDNPLSVNKDGYAVMEKKERIIAFCGLMPYKFHFFGNDIDGYIYHDSMVDYAERGKGLGTTLINEINEVLNQSKQFSMAVWMNAPNSRVFEKCGWKEVKNLSSYVKIYNIEPIIRNKLDTKIESLNNIIFKSINMMLSVIDNFLKILNLFSDNKFKVISIDKFDGRIDKFYQKVKKEFCFSSYQSKDILNWKYSQGDFPGFQKMICLNANSEMAGYVVFKTKEIANTRITTIFDFLCSVKNSSAMIYLLKKAIIEIEKDKPDFIEVMCSNKSLLKVFKRFGFIKRGENKFALKYLHEDSVISSNLLSKGQNWHFTFGDGDLLFWN